MDAHGAARTGVAPFTSSGSRWRGVSIVPSLPARRPARFPKPRCNQPECHPPVRPPPVCLPEECPPPKCPPAEWPPPPPCCASAGASRHIKATKVRMMRVGRTRKAIRLAMAFPSPGNLFPVYSCSRAREYSAEGNRPNPNANRIMKSPESDSATEDHQPNTPIRSEKFPAMWQQRRHSLKARSCHDRG